jgi:histidinol-phosphate aminotransferase
VPGTLAQIADSFFRPAVNDLVPYEPGKPVEEVQRELGLERVVKLASNEGPYGPFPQAREAIARAVDELNRYPDGGAYRLRAALTERFDVRFEEVAVGAGSDGLVDCLSQAVLEPGDEIVCGWPSFPS